MPLAGHAQTSVSVIRLCSPRARVLNLVARKVLSLTSEQQGESNAEHSNAQCSQDGRGSRACALLRSGGAVVP